MRLQFGNRFAVGTTLITYEKFRVVIFDVFISSDKPQDSLSAVWERTRKICEQITVISTIEL